MDIRPLITFCIVYFTVVSVALLATTDTADGAVQHSTRPTYSIKQVDSTPDLVIAEAQHSAASDLDSVKFVRGAKRMHVTYRMASIDKAYGYDFGFYVRQSDALTSVYSIESDDEVRTNTGGTAWVCNGSSAAIDWSTGIVRQSIPLRCLPGSGSVLGYVKAYVYTPKAGYWSLVGSDDMQVWSSRLGLRRSL